MRCGGEIPFRGGEGLACALNAHEWGRGGDAQDFCDFRLVSQWWSLDQNPAVQVWYLGKPRDRRRQSFPPRAETVLVIFQLMQALVRHFHCTKALEAVGDNSSHDHWEVSFIVVQDPDLIVHHTGAFANVAMSCQ